MSVSNSVVPRASSVVGVVLFSMFAARGLVTNVFSRHLSTTSDTPKRKKSPLYTRTGDKGTSSVRMIKHVFLILRFFLVVQW